ncbi:MAG: hypothetical protein ACR2GQ_04420 [Gemmatimonadota bacterium]|jgi:hypothetical protein
MTEPDELKIPLSPEERRRIEQTAESSGLDAEVWAKEVLFRILAARETREDKGER